MSSDAERIETDLEAFREQAISEQAKLLYHQEVTGDCQVALDRLDPRIWRILGDYGRVGLTGEVYWCDVRKDDMYDQIPLDKGDVVFGEFDGMDVCSSNKGILASPTRGGRLVIAYSVIKPSGVYYDPEDNESNKYVYGFAPVETSRLVVPDAFIPSYPMPEIEDAVASQIDDCLLDDCIDFCRLKQLFIDVSACMNDMEMDYYLWYLNKAIALEGYITSIATDRYIVQNFKGEEMEFCYLEDETVVELTTRFDQFSFHKAEGLCLEIYGIDTKAIYPLENLFAMTVEPNATEETMSSGFFDGPVEE